MKLEGMAADDTITSGTLSTTTCSLSAEVVYYFSELGKNLNSRFNYYTNLVLNKIPYH